MGCRDGLLAFGIVVVGVIVLLLITYGLVATHVIGCLPMITSC